MLRVVTICSSGRPLASIPAIRTRHFACIRGSRRFPMPISPLATSTRQRIMAQSWVSDKSGSLCRRLSRDLRVFQRDTGLQRRSILLWDTKMADLPSWAKADMAMRERTCQAEGSHGGKFILTYSPDARRIRASPQPRSGQNCSLLHDY
jgi:hypothetical protein